MLKKLKFSIICNTNTARGRKLKLINEVVKLLKRNHEVELFKTVSEVDATIVFEKLSNKIFDRIVIAGGDGSVCFAINQIIKVFKKNPKPLLGYIPAGTANILQFETQMKNKALEIYNVLVADKTKKINLAKINDKYFFLMTGVGFDSKVVESIDIKAKKYLGKVIYALKGLQHFLFLKNEKMKVEIDNQEIKADWVLCTNSKYYAGPHSITSDTNVFDNKIIVYVFKDLTRRKLIHYMWLILTKGDLSSAKSILKINLEKLKISGINGEVLSQVDGENFGYSNEVNIQNVRENIEILVP